MTIEIDQMPPQGLTDDIMKLDHVVNAILIRAL